MKRIILIAALILTGIKHPAAAEILRITSYSELQNASSGIKNGWYDATVKYTNYSTYKNATYTLQVYVEFNNVIKVDFGNGGSIHTGYNNEGYSYSGGFLSFENDFNGNTIAATTTVTTTDNNGTRTYQIRIE